MQEQQPASPIVSRLITVLGILALVGIIGYFALRWKVEYAPVRWNGENFTFQSGPRCFVFHEPKLAIFLGDGGAEEVFDNINQCGYTNILTVNGFSTSSDSWGDGSVVFFSHTTQLGKMTMEFLDGKCGMVVSARGTKLTLADGREFTLDGKTPLWLRCKSDGTIVQLDELPKGFVEFFESPPSDSMMHTSVTSYPEAFRK